MSDQPRDTRAFNDLVEAGAQRVLRAILDSGAKGIESAVWMTCQDVSLWREKQDKYVAEDKAAQAALKRGGLWRAASKLPAQEAEK